MRLGSNAMRYQVLIAEDNSADVGLVREALKAHKVDCQLQVASDGAAAISLIERLDADPRAPLLDLLIMDMHLPKRDGEEILKCLRSTERYAQVPVLVMTSSESPALEETATKHAALSYFRKPSRFDEFLEIGLIAKRILAKTSGEGPPLETPRSGQP
jgi:CheY-like chemotaxis protein